MRSIVSASLSKKKRKEKKNNSKYGEEWNSV
jgi:hypothetical protein